VTKPRSKGRPARLCWGGGFRGGNFFAAVVLIGGKNTGLKLLPKGCKRAGPGFHFACPLTGGSTAAFSPFGFGFPTPPSSFLLWLVFYHLNCHGSGNPPSFHPGRSIFFTAGHFGRGGDGFFGFFGILHGVRGHNSYFALGGGHKFFSPRGQAANFCLASGGASFACLFLLPVTV